jgi:hypothetical protein
LCTRVDFACYLPERGHRSWSPVQCVWSALSARGAWMLPPCRRTATVDSPSRSCESCPSRPAVPLYVARGGVLPPGVSARRVRVRSQCCCGPIEADRARHRHPSRVRFGMVPVRVSPTVSTQPRCGGDPRADLPVPWSPLPP